MTVIGLAAFELSTLVISCGGAVYCHIVMLKYNNGLHWDDAPKIAI